MELSRRFEGKKFMWDCKTYPDENQAQETLRKYEADGFMSHLVKEENQFYIFTRREIKEVVIEGKPV